MRDRALPSGVLGPPSRPFLAFAARFASETVVWDAEAVVLGSEAVDTDAETVDSDMGCTPSMKIHVEVRAIAMREPVYYTIEETGGVVLKFRACPAEWDAEGGGCERLGPSAP
jgi:hypothetical protein